MSKDSNEDQGYETDKEEEVPQQPQQSVQTPLQLEDEDLEYESFGLISFGSSRTHTPSVSSADSIHDEITEAHRDKILKPQLAIFVDYFQEHNPELLKHTEDHIKFRKFLNTLAPDSHEQKAVDVAFKDPKVKQSLEAIEIKGYKYIDDTFKDKPTDPKLTAINWGGKPRARVRSTTYKNDLGQEILTITQTNHDLPQPINITKSNGDVVAVKSYKTVDFPITLENSPPGYVHFSYQARDQNGNIKDGLYFSVHYEEHPGPEPKLKEMSHPQPIKFAGAGSDAIAYVEHKGEVYTLSVTREQYFAMQKQIEINMGRGQSVEVTQEIVQEQQQVSNEAIPTNAPPPNREAPPNGEGQQPQAQGPSPTRTTTPPLQNQGQSTGSAATALTNGGMQGLLEYVNVELTQDHANTDRIVEATKAILTQPNTSIEDQKSNITILAMDFLDKADLSADFKVIATIFVADVIADSKSISGLENAEMLENLAATVMQHKDLDLEHKKDAIAGITEAALSLADSSQALQGITKAVAKNTSLDNQAKEEIVGAMLEAVTKSDTLTPEAKIKAVGDIADTISKSEIPDASKGKMFENMTDTVLKNFNDPADQKAALERITQAAASITDPATREAAIKDITNSMINSDSQNTGDLLKTVQDGITQTELSSEEKAKLGKNVLDKGIGAKIPPLEQQQQMQEIANKAREEEITKEVDGILKSSSLNPESKKQNISDVVQWVMDNPQFNHEKQAELITKITENVVNTPEPFLTKEDRLNIVTAVAEIVIAKDKDMIKAVDQGIDNSKVNDTEKAEFHEVTKNVVNRHLEKNNELPNPTNKDLESQQQSNKENKSNEHIPENVQETSSFLNEIKVKAKEFGDKIRKRLSPSGDLSDHLSHEEQKTQLTAEFKRDDFAQGAQDKQKQFINELDKKLVQNRSLSKDDRLEVINSLIVYHTEKRGQEVSKKDAAGEIGREKTIIRNRNPIIVPLMEARDKVQLQQELPTATVSKPHTPPGKGQSSGREL